MELLFWLLVILIVYPYVIFPLVLRVLACTVRCRESVVHERGPVTIVCAVHNEEKIIADKIRNFYAIAYPQSRLFIGLDGCTDATEDVIERSIPSGDDRVRYFVYPRQGKAATLNALMREVITEHVIFTDANTMFDSDAVTALVRHMQPETGVVCGRLKLLDRTGASGEGFYWRLETFIKQHESRFGAVMGANGGIYLIRRSLFEELPRSTINDDFSISMKIFEKGYDSAYATDAVATETISGSDTAEFRRHVRDAAGHYRAMMYLYRLLMPCDLKRFFFYMSHRVIRWLAPGFIIGAFVVSLSLWSTQLYKILTMAQGGIYCAALLVHFTGIRARVLYIPYYFLLINLALLLGCINTLTGRQKVTWTPEPRSTPASATKESLLS